MLDLIWCEGFIDGCLKIFVNSCFKVFSFSLRGCDWVIVFGVWYVVENFKDLIVFDFKWSYGINDVVVEFVVKNFLEVIFLDVKDCFFVISDGIGYVIKYFIKIKYLSFGGGDYMYFVNSV